MSEIKLKIGDEEYLLTEIPDSHFVYYSEEPMPFKNTNWYTDFEYVRRKYQSIVIDGKYYSFEPIPKSKERETEIQIEQRKKDFEEFLKILENLTSNNNVSVWSEIHKHIKLYQSELDKMNMPTIEQYYNIDAPQVKINFKAYYSLTEKERENWEPVVESKNTHTIFAGDKHGNVTEIELGDTQHPTKRYTEKDMVEFATQWASFLIVSEQKPSIVDFLKTFNEEREKNQNKSETE